MIPDHDETTAGSESVRAQEPAQRPFKAVERGGLARLPKKIREELECRLENSSFRSYAALSEWLSSEGYNVTRRSLKDYRTRFERRLESIRLATEQAREVCKQFKADDLSMQQALMRLVQTEMFVLLTGVHEDKLRASGGGGKTRGAPINVTAVARTVAGLVKASIVQQQWARQISKQVQAKVGKAAKKVEAARKDGLSDTAAGKIRDALLKIQV